MSLVSQRAAKTAKALQPMSTIWKRLNAQAKPFDPATRPPQQQPPKPSQPVGHSNVASGLSMTKPLPETRSTPIKQPQGRNKQNSHYRHRGNPRAQLPMWGPRQPLPWTHTMRMAQRSSYRNLLSVGVPSVGVTHVHEGGKGQVTPSL